MMAVGIYVVMLLSWWVGSGLFGVGARCSRSYNGLLPLYPGRYGDASFYLHSNGLLIGRCTFSSQRIVRIVYKNPDRCFPMTKSRVISKLSQLLAMLGATLSRFGTMPLYMPLIPSVLTIMRTASHIPVYW